MSTISLLFIYAGAGLTIGYAALTTYLLMRVRPVPITVIPQRGSSSGRSGRT